MQHGKICENGICAEIDKKVIHLWRWHHGELTQLPDSSFSEEITIALRYRSSHEFEQYEKLLKHGKCEDFEKTILFTKEQMQECIDIALKTAEAVTAKNVIIGELLYADIMNRINLTDNGTESSYEQLFMKLLEALELSGNFIHVLFQLIVKSFDYDDLKIWFQKCVLKNNSLLCRRQHFEFIQRYVFTNFADYYAFMFLHFAQEYRRIQVCEFCGKIFVPKTKRITKYCDKINPIYSKPCRDIAPKEYMNAKIDSCAALDEYNKVKNRNYKRMERLLLKDNITPSEELSVRQQYETWYQKASMARKQYLADEISEQEFEKIIYKIN